MRILLLNDDYPPRTLNSVSAISASLAECYAAQGHEILVTTTHRTDISRNILREGNVVSLPRSYRAGLRQYKSLWSPHMSRMLEREMRSFRPEAVHAHNIHRYLTYDALRVARTFTPRVVITMHDVMSIAESRLATARFLASQGKDARLSPADHWRMVDLEWNPFRNFCIRHRLARSVQTVVAVSESLRSALIQNGITDAAVVPNGIDLARWTTGQKDIDAFRETHGLAGRNVILFGGRLSFDKGTTPLLQALARVRATLPSVLLLVAGDARKWEAMVSASGIHEDLSAHIRVTGWLSAEDLKRAFFACDLATTPSLCLDTFNLMNIEAMASAKPVVGTIFGGTPEIVEDGETGFTCDPRDTARYTEALLAILKDDALARRMGEQGRRRVEEHFTLDRQADAYLALLTGSH